MVRKHYKFIRVPDDVALAIVNSKQHPRETNYDVIKRLLKKRG